MKQTNKLYGLIAIVAIINFGFVLTACKDGNGNEQPKPLTGTVNIDGTMEVGETATIIVTGSNGAPEKFTYQWVRTADGENAVSITGANGETYVITEADVDHTLGAIVSNEDTTGTITGNATAKVKQKETPDPVKTETVAGFFGGRSADIFGKTSLVDANKDKIVSVFNAAYTAAGPAQGNFRSVFNRNITICITESGARLKSDAAGKIIYFRLDYLDDSNNLTTIKDMIGKMQDLESYELAKTSTRDAVRIADTKAFAKSVFDG